MRHLRAVAFVAFVGIAAFGTGCRKPEEGTVEGSMEVAGRDRTYLYHHPPGWNGDQKWPLVLALHGRSGQGVNQERLTHLTDVADREGFVVVYPDGHRRSWHDARDTGPAADDGVDDIAFVSALIDHFVADHSVDASRVFVTGMSNGGLMSYRVACELADKIAAAAPVAALMADNPAYDCKPSRPVPMMIVAGDDDSLIPYEGGDVAGNDDKGRVMSAHATRAKWAELNGCDGADVQQTIDPVDDGTRVEEMRHSRCRDGAQVVLFTVHGGGHTWPNGDQYLPEAVIGKTTRDIDASEQLWSFFQARPAAVK